MKLCKMVLKEEKKRLEKLLAEAVPLLCKNGLAQNTAFCVQAMIGITISTDTADNDDLILVCFKQMISDSGTVTLEPYGQSNIADATRPTSKVCKTEPAECTENNHCKDSPRDVESFGQGDSVKQESVDNTVYNVDDEEYGENDAEYIEDEEPYEGEDTTEAAQYDGDDGEEEYYDDPNYVASDYNSEMADYDDGSGSYVIKSEPIKSYSSSQQYMSASSCSKSLQRHHNKSQGFHNTTGFPRTPRFSGTGIGRMAHLFPSTVGTSRQKGRRSMSTTVGSSPHGSKLAKSTVSVPTDASFQGGYSRTVTDLCEQLVQQSSVEGECHVCHICSARLSNATSLRNHIRGTHLALKSVRCNVCGETFKWAMQLLRHKRREHGADGTQLVVFQ